MHSQKFYLRSLAVSLIFALAACQENPNARQGSKTDTPQAPAVSSAQQSVKNISAGTDPAARQVYWGDTHLHTTNSADAFAFGARLSPDAAYRFAKGETVTSSTGLPAKLARPLDFLVVADHGEGLGISSQILAGNPALIADPDVAQWSRMMQAGGDQAAAAAMDLIDRFSAGTMPGVFTDPKIVGPIIRSVWTDQNAIAEQHNDPGTFTAFIGYEYTALNMGNNLHRVVVFRDGADKTDQVMPFPATQSINPEDLWTALAAYEAKTGGQVLAIPHNGNLSNGQMFAMSDIEGAAIDADYARKSARWEPLVEVTQIKGDSESHPYLSPDDAFASYGVTGWELGNLNMSQRKTKDMLAGEYVREALKRGLQLEAGTGHNPFKYGMIGSTDSHTALASASSDNFFGKHTDGEPGPERASKVYKSPTPGEQRAGWHYLSGGYAAVWAEDNTREALFDAMMRKEVYATTGPRMTVRLFAGWDFKAGDEAADGFAGRGYQAGVPMGGDLTKGPKAGAPRFIVSALKDPASANLDRIQMVKGWRDESGKLHETVYDIAWQDARRPGADGRLPPVGNTADISKPGWSDTIGAPALRAFWKDPDFDAGEAAFYYLRVLEIPTPRWTAYDAVRYGAKIPENAVMTAQQRAYSSPVWYTP